MYVLQVALREVGMAKAVVSAKRPHIIEWVSTAFSFMFKIEAAMSKLPTYVCLPVAVT